MSYMGGKLAKKLAKHKVGAQVKKTKKLIQLVLWAMGGGKHGKKEPKDPGAYWSRLN
jgi:hypothetical protein